MVAVDRDPTRRSANQREFSNTREDTRVKEKGKARGTAAKKEAERAWWANHLLEMAEDERLAKLAFELLSEAYRSAGAAVWHEDFVRAGVSDVESAIADLQDRGYEIWIDFECRRRGEQEQGLYRLMDDEPDEVDDEEVDDDEGGSDA